MAYGPIEGPAVDLGKGVRLGATLRADPFDVEHEGPLELRGRVHGDELAVEHHVVAIGCAVDEAPAATGAEVQLGDGGGRSVFAPPTCHQGRIGESPPDG